MEVLIDTLLDISGDVITAFFGAFVVYIGVQFILAIFQHKADRRGYQYSRSSKTGEMRFEKEIYHLEKLSSALLRLVVITREIDQNSHRCNKKQIEGWESARAKCISALGAAAPFINYIDLEHGGTTCGALATHCDRKKDNKSDDSERLAWFENCLNEGSIKSLYIRAALIIDGCTRLVTSKYRNLNFRFIFPDEVYKLGKQNAQICKTIEHYQEINIEYQHFINCAYCRLRDSETGFKDARRQRIKELPHRYWEWVFSWIYNWANPECPFGENEMPSNAKRHSSKLDVVRMVAGVVALLALAIFFISTLLIAFHFVTAEPVVCLAISSAFAFVILFVVLVIWGATTLIQRRM